MKKMNGIAIGLSAVLLSAFAAAPAQATPESLPSTQKVFAIDSSDHWVNGVSQSLAGVVWNLNPSDAGGTLVGPATPAVNGAYTASYVDAGAYNPVTKKSYIIVEDQGGSQAIFQVNLTTGVKTWVSNIPSGTSYYGLAFDNAGHAWVNTYSDYIIRGLDVTTGQLTGQTITITGTSYYMRHLAYDYKNSVMYALMENDSTHDFAAFSIDMTPNTGGAATLVQEFSNFPTVPSNNGGTDTGHDGINSIAFDSNGIGWLSIQANGTGMAGGSSCALGTWNPQTQVVTPIQNIYAIGADVHDYRNHEFTAPVILLSHVGADVIAPVVKKGITLKVGKKLALKTLATKLGLKPTAKSKITATVAKTSAKFCKVVKTNLVGTKKGACKVTVKTVTGKVKKSKTGTVTIN